MILKTSLSPKDQKILCMNCMSTLIILITFTIIAKCILWTELMVWVHGVSWKQLLKYTEKFEFSTRVGTIAH